MRNERYLWLHFPCFSWHCLFALFCKDLLQVSLSFPFLFFSISSHPFLPSCLFVCLFNCLFVYQERAWGQVHILYCTNNVGGICCTFVKIACRWTYGCVENLPWFRCQNQNFTFLESKLSINTYYKKFSSNIHMRPYSKINEQLRKIKK